MSWDVLLQKLPRTVRRPEDVPDDYDPPVIGSRAEVTSALRKLFRNIEDGDVSFLTLSRSAFTIEFNLGNQEPCSQLLLHVRGDHAQAAKAVLRIADCFGARAIDCSTSEFIEKGGKREVSEKEREDEARYRRQIEEYRKNPVAPPVWPLSGVECKPCERYVYISLLPGESAIQQQKAVFRNWREMFKLHGESLPGTMGPHFLFTLPDGEVFGDFSVGRCPALVTETVAQMLPRVEKGAALMHAFAAATGRQSGEIENGSEFVCADGRRIPLAQCKYQQLWTEADYAKKHKANKTTRQTA
jgi:hypothetical protein